MNRRLQPCLVSLMVVAISGAVFAQSGGNVPLQRAVSVQLAVTTNAVAVPNADRQDGLDFGADCRRHHISSRRRSPNAC